METVVPEKAELLNRLSQGGFNVPDFIYVSADDFKNQNFEALEAFLYRHRESFKVIARSAHPKEQYFKGGTFLTTWTASSRDITARPASMACNSTT